MAVKQNNDGSQSPGVGLNNSSGGGFPKLCEDDDVGGGGGGGGGGGDGVGAGGGINGGIGAANHTVNGLSAKVKHDIIDVDNDDDSRNSDSNMEESEDYEELTIANFKVSTSSESNKNANSQKDINQILELINMVQNGNLKLTQNEIVNMYHHIIVELSNIKPPNKNLSSFKEKLQKVGKFFAAANDKVVYTFFLREVYQIIAQEHIVQPSSAIAIIFQLFDKDSILEAVYSLLDLNIPDSELLRTISLLVLWLRTTTFCNNLHLWIMALLIGIKSRNRIDLYHQICYQHIDTLFVSTILPVLRPKVSPVVFHILTNVTETPTVFHKIIPKFPTVISTLKLVAQNNNQFAKDTRNYLQHLVDLSCALMVRFYGFEDLYKSLENTLKDFSPSFNYLSYAKMPPQDSDSEDDLFRGTKSKVGLVNLGNTCYMNCVLQALAMTKEFSREVILTKSSAPILIKMQEQIALMLYSLRYELTPTKILNAVRPPNFIRGLQHDSSEFLSYLLDTLHEQELSYRNDDIIINELEIESSRLAILSADEMSFDDNNQLSNDTNGSEKILDTIYDNSLWNMAIPICSLDTPSTDDSDISNCTVMRMDVAGNCDDIIPLANKIESSNEYSNSASSSSSKEPETSTNSGSTDDSIENASENIINPFPPNVLTLTENPAPSIVDMTFSGKIVTTFKCSFCGWKSRNIDAFRDLQLSFPDDKLSGPVGNYSVQDLIDYYSSPEKLYGDNKYFCDNCRKLRDAERFISFMAAPKNLILTLKHFRYDSICHMRAKLMHKVFHDEKVFLKVCCPDTDKDAKILVYDLYACVVHSGYSMDSGHYYTYAADASDQWYKFDDSHVSPADLGELHNLSSPNTPYILFYRMTGEAHQTDSDPDSFITTPVILTKLLPPLKIDELPNDIRTFVVNDNNAYTDELKVKRFEVTNAYKPKHENIIRRDNYGDDDDDLPPLGGCGSNSFDYINRYVF